MRLAVGLDSDAWELYCTYETRSAADVVAGRLESEGVSTQLIELGVVPGLEAGCELWIEKRLAHRARWVLAQAPATEAELIELATGGPDNAPKRRLEE